jgi:O-antigen/teichoic acid export membrane protein
MPVSNARAAVAEVPPGTDAARTATWWRSLQALSLTAGAQSGIQLIAIITGLAVVRLLPVREYAYYTIANAALGSLTVLTDCGVTQSVLALGGNVWQRPAALGAVVAGGLRMRRIFAVLAMTVAIPFVFAQLRQQGAESSTALLVTLSILPLLLSSITVQVLEVVPRLHQRLGGLQRIQLASAALRFLSTVAAVSLYPLAWLATLGAGIAQTWAMWRTARLAGTLAELQAAPDRSASREMTRMVARAAPNAIYYALSGQITVWLIAFLGTTSAVAQVGALGRLAMIYNVVTAAFTVMVVPRFARAQFAQRRGALTRYWRAQLALLVPLGLIMAVVAVFPRTVLLLLGTQYLDLLTEVLLAAAGGAVGTLAGIAYALAAARGVITSPWLVVPVALLVQAGLILSLPMSTVSGVLWLGVFSNLTLWTIYSLYFTCAVLRRE